MSLWMESFKAAEQQLLSPSLFTETLVAEQNSSELHPGFFPWTKQQQSLGSSRDLSIPCMLVFWE